jgi:putative glutamine amidotransferase
MARGTLPSSAKTDEPSHRDDAPDRPLRIGLSARLLHQVPAEMGFRGKTLQYLEQSVSHWILAHGALALMVPTLGYDAEVSRRKISVREVVALLDGLVLQGGADVNPQTYGQTTLRPEWNGDLVRDRYEMELIEGFLAAGKPLLGICRGCQLLNVAFGGTLVQDLPSQRPEVKRHVDADLYDELHHGIEFVSGTRLAGLYPDTPTAVVNSIHHQAIDRLGGDLIVEARSTEDGVVEAIRATGSTPVFAVQWHPEFQRERTDLLDPDPIMQDFLLSAKQRRQV